MSYLQYATIICYYRHIVEVDGEKEWFELLKIELEGFERHLYMDQTRLTWRQHTR